MYSFSEYQSLDEGKKKGLWDNIHAKRKRGEKPAKPGDKDYPETLNVEGYAPGDVDQKVGAVTSIPKKEQEAARKRLLAKAAAKRKSKESKCEEVEHINEEEYDRMRDRKLERYGSGYRSAGNRRYTARSGGTQPKPMPKKKDGPSALDIVKGEIEKKYGKGAIMDTSKNKK